MLSASDLGIYRLNKTSFFAYCSTVPKLKRSLSKAFFTSKPSSPQPSCLIAPLKRLFLTRDHTIARLPFFQVVSRGRILSHNTTDSFDGMFKSWSFRVSKEMSPSARLIGYYIDNNERVVADSVLLKIEDKLPTKVS